MHALDVAQSVDKAIIHQYLWGQHLFMMLDKKWAEGDHQFSNRGRVGVGAVEVYILRPCVYPSGGILLSFGICHLIWSSRLLCEVDIIPL